MRTQKPAPGLSIGYNHCCASLGYVCGLQPSEEVKKKKKKILIRETETETEASP